MNCKYCRKHLVVVADKRKNGVTHHNDWENREYHKKCYKILVEMRAAWTCFQK